MTRNFTDKELACKHCGKTGIKKSFADQLQLLRDKIGAPIVVTSGYRCAEHPAEIGKPKWTIKRHREGIAADIYCPTIPLEKLFEIVVSMPQFTGVGVDIHSGFIHVDCRPNNQAAFWAYNEKGVTIPWTGTWSELKGNNHDV